MVKAVFFMTFNIIQFICFLEQNISKIEYKGETLLLPLDLKAEYKEAMIRSQFEDLFGFSDEDLLWFIDKETGVYTGIKTLRAGHTYILLDRKPKVSFFLLCFVSFHFLLFLFLFCFVPFYFLLFFYSNFFFIYF
jgi:hypothetical protein